MPNVNAYNQAADLINKNLPFFVIEKYEGKIITPDFKIERPGGQKVGKGVISP